MSQRRMRTVAGRALALLVAGLAVLVLGLVVVVPAVAGGTTYTILTGSMRPGMPPGTVVVVRHRPFDQIERGDVVTYQIESGRPEVATHRVVKVLTGLDGTRTLVTQGDANDVPDPKPVRAVQVRGVRWYKVPYVGLPSLWVGKDLRQLVVTGSVVFLLGYSAISFAGAARDGVARRRRTSSPERALEETSR